MAALYLLALFAAAAAAPHHHLDPIADLISERPSNSGTFAQISSPQPRDDGFYPGGLVQDISCLACFHSDFVASQAVVLELIQPPQAAPAGSLPPVSSEAALVLADTVSRAPPSLS